MADNLTVYEDFVDLYLVHDILLAIFVFFIYDTLLRMNLSLICSCRGQYYDCASNMAVIRSGAAQ